MKIEDFFRDHNVEIRRHGEHHHTTQGWISVDCPNCSPHAGSFRLGWNLAGNYFSCWSCGKPPTLSTLSTLTGLPTSAVRKLFYDDIQVQPYEERVAGQYKPPSQLGPLQYAHTKYLKRRGFEDIKELMDLWKIQGINQYNPEFAWRIFIPVIYDGQPISWTTRATGEDNPLRYCAAKSHEEKFPAKETLYGIGYVQHSIIIVEGPIDVWKIGPGATATMGTGYTKAQMLMASRFPNRYICFDKEGKAQEIAMKLARDLMMFPGTTKNIVLDSGKDPGNCDDSELEELKGLLV